MLIIAVHENGTVTRNQSVTPTDEWDMPYAHSVAEAIFASECNGQLHVSVAFWDGEVLYNSYRWEDFADHQRSQERF